MYQAGGIDLWQLDIVAGNFETKMSAVSELWLAGVDGLHYNLLYWVYKRPSRRLES